MGGEVGLLRACNTGRSSQTDDYYFTYYVLNANLVLALAISTVIGVVSLFEYARCLTYWGMLIVTVVCMLILFFDAWMLRKETSHAQAIG